MQYLSRRYGVYRLGGGRYLLSTMSAGIRDRRQPTPRNHKKKRMTMTAFNKAFCRYRSLFFVAAVLSAAQGFLLVMSLSSLLLMFSLYQCKKAAKTRNQ